MHAGTFTDTVRNTISALWSSLRRLVRLYLRGGTPDDEWSEHNTIGEVIDINTRQPIRGYVMRKVIDGKWVYRAMTDEEHADYVRRTAW